VTHQDRALFLRVHGPGNYRCKAADLGILITKGRMQTAEGLTDRVWRYIRYPGADMWGPLSSGHAEFGPDCDQDQGSYFPDSCRVDGARSRCQGWPKATPEGGLALTSARTTSRCAARGGEGPWGQELGQRVVARRVVEADMRGLVTAGPCVRLGALRGSKNERGQVPLRGTGLAAHSPRGALLLALRFLDSGPHGA
jgi:hypothetical protein